MVQITIKVLNELIGIKSSATNQIVLLKLKRHFEKRQNFDIFIDVSSVFPYTSIVTAELVFVRLEAYILLFKIWDGIYVNDALTRQRQSITDASSVP